MHRELLYPQSFIQHEVWPTENLLEFQKKNEKLCIIKRWEVLLLHFLKKEEKLVYSGYKAYCVKSSWKKKYVNLKFLYLNPYLFPLCQLMNFYLTHDPIAILKLAGMDDSTTQERTTCSAFGLYLCELDKYH